MPRPVDRRVFLVLASSVSVAALSRCSDVTMPSPDSPTSSAARRNSLLGPTATTDPSESPDPTETPEPTDSLTPTALGNARFGPNGAHFPVGAPDPRTGATTVVSAAPSGSSILAALKSLSAAQINAGAIVAMQSGQITDGLWALDNFKNPGNRPITVCPAQGFGAVTVSGNGFVLTGVDGVNLTGIITPTFQLKGCTRTSVSRTIVSENYASISTTRGLNSSDCGMYEVVMLDSKVKSSDSSQIQNQRAGFQLSNVTIAGCVIAPSYYEDGNYGDGGSPRPHNDSMQITCSSIAPNVGLTIKDTQIWSSNNSAMIITGPAQNVLLDNALIVGGTTSQARYPFLPGGAGYPGAQSGPGSLSAIQGIGAGSTDSVESVLIGSTSPQWRTVSGTRVSLSRVADLSSGFSEQDQLQNYSDSDFTALGAPRFTQASLKQLWDYSALSTS